MGLLFHVDVWAQGGRHEQESGGLHAVRVKHLWEMLSDKGATRRVTIPVIVCTNHFQQ